MNKNIILKTLNQSIFRSFFKAIFFNSEVNLQDAHGLDWIWGDKFINLLNSILPHAQKSQQMLLSHKIGSRSSGHGGTTKQNLHIHIPYLVQRTTNIYLNQYSF